MTHSLGTVRTQLIRFLLFFFEGSDHHRDLHSFPTRRSSDLPGLCDASGTLQGGAQSILGARTIKRDRKSTRLNSSHRCISYAVFCLKKKMSPNKRLVCANHIGMNMTNVDETITYYTNTIAYI